MESNNRINWVDIAKGLGIYLIVLGHLSQNSIIARYIYSFHVPLFFFLSGYIFNLLKYQKYTRFLKRKVLSLLIPYVSFSIITLIFFLLLKLAGYNYFKIMDISIEAYLISVLKGYPININGPLWFLICLFITENLFYIICKIKDRLTNLLVGILLFSIVGFILSKSDVMIIPINIIVSLIAVSFFGAGYIFKNYISEKISLSKISFLLILMFSINIFIAFTNKKVDIIGNQFGNVILFYLGSFSGIAFITMISSFLSKISLLRYCGNNSLIILCSHKFFLIIFMIILGKIGIYSYLLRYNLLVLIYGILVIISILPLINFINKYASFIIGKSAVFDCQ